MEKEKAQTPKLPWILRVVAVVAAIGLVLLVQLARIFDPEFDPRQPRT